MAWLLGPMLRLLETVMALTLKPIMETSGIEGIGANLVDRINTSDMANLTGLLDEGVSS